ncbi:MAG: dephospho-CoA kinase [Bacteroidota bacterium]
MPRNKPVRVGLTGGIGSGKSTVGMIFKSLDVPIFDSDFEAKRILSSDVAVMERVKDHFGTESYDESGLNREHLSKVVFSDPVKRETLNGIVHPEVGRAFEKFCSDRKEVPYVLKEAAILIESGAHKHLDFLILVTAPEELKISRVMNRDKSELSQVIARMRAQSSDGDKRPFADFEIHNDENAHLIPQVLQIHNAILGHE